MLTSRGYAENGSS